MEDNNYLYLYDETSLSFLKKWKAEARKIMESEMGLKFHRTRFTFRGLSRPFQLVVFEHPKKLGHFDPKAYRVGLNRNLMWQAKDEVIRQILRHELAHFYCYMRHGEWQEGPHDKNFRNVCREFGWGEEVWSAKASVEKLNAGVEGDLVSEKLLARVKKLMALGESSNPHEAEAATVKANQLLLKHNLSHLKDLDGFQSEDKSSAACLKIVYKAKRNSQKLSAIYSILEHFFVQPVFSYTNGEVRLEVTGRRVNVELADYVTKFLDREFETLWQQVKKERSDVKGKRAKNAFFKGLAEGFSQKMAEAKRQTQKSSSNGEKDLVLLQKDLQRQVQQVYGRLGSRARTETLGDEKSESLGKEKGRNLNIHSPLANNKKGRPKRLGLFR